VCRARRACGSTRHGSRTRPGQTAPRQFAHTRTARSVGPRCPSCQRIAGFHGFRPRTSLTSPTSSKVTNSNASLTRRGPIRQTSSGPSASSSPLVHRNAHHGRRRSRRAAQRLLDEGTGLFNRSGARALVFFLHWLYLRAEPEKSSRPAVSKPGSAAIRRVSRLPLGARAIVVEFERPFIPTRAAAGLLMRARPRAPRDASLRRFGLFA